jgi:hypothetical protein
MNPNGFLVARPKGASSYGNRCIADYWVAFQALPRCILFTPTPFPGDSAVSGDYLERAETEEVSCVNIFSRAISMIFHATHKHDHHSCPAHDAEKKANFMKAIQSADEIGVKVHGFYADVPGHTIFMILETDAVEKIVQFFDPIVDMGDTDIRPVVDPMAAIRLLKDK